jgi:hypothetical protein
MMNKLLPATVLLVLALDAPTSRASLISPSQINSVILGDAATSDLATVVEFFGADTTAQLPFTGTVNSSGWSWQSTGDTYSGKPLSISSNGTFDPVTNTGSWSSSGSLGAKSWSSAGTLRFDPAQQQINVVEFGILDGLEFDREKGLTLVLLRHPPIYITTGRYTLGGLPNGPPFNVRDDLLFPDLPGLQKFGLERIAPPPNQRFVVRIEGSLQQGVLSGDASVNPAPEPPAWILLGLGMSGLVGFYGYTIRKTVGTNRSCRIETVAAA